VGNNPVNFNDPTGHMTDDGDDGGGKCDKQCLEKLNKKDDDSKKRNGNQCGQGGVFDCPQRPNACYRNTVCMVSPKIDLHPYDIIDPLIVGVSLIHSDNGEITGYRHITAVSDYQNYTIHWEILNPQFVFQKVVDEGISRTIEQNFEFMGKTAASSAFHKISVVLNVYDVLKVGNQFITFKSANIKIGPIIPQRTNLPMPEVADPRGYFGIP
jgi:hypothetical protein